MAKRRIESGEMFNQLVCFAFETLPAEDVMMVYPNSPDIFIMIAGCGKDLVLSTTSDDHERTMEVLKRAVMLHKESKLEVADD